MIYTMPRLIVLAATSAAGLCANGVAASSLPPKGPRCAAGGTDAADEKIPQVLKEQCLSPSDENTTPLNNEPAAPPDAVES